MVAWLLRCPDLDEQACFEVATTHDERTMARLWIHMEYPVGAADLCLGERGKRDDGEETEPEAEP